MLQSSAQAVQDELNDGFGMQLLVPESEVSLGERVVALGSWTTGFMAGFAMALAEEGRPAATLSEDGRETLKDLAAISQVGDEVDGDCEEAERDLFELCEYVRLASVQLYLEYADVADEADSSEYKLAAISSPAGLFGKTVH